ncbi:MAG: hypothetical protein KTR35_07595 [Gammaproteobacteria bacterium]|nr:hypothetical protein [Gammaproteobacteria bacterium]
MSELSNVNAQLTANSAAGKGNNKDSSWFETMAEAWGAALDNQAARMISQAETITGGQETPANITMLTAESLRMQFLSNSSHTALTSTGTALETMARKQ